MGGGYAFVILTAVFTDAVKDGTGIIDGEAMVREDMFLEFVEIGARDMEESAARGTF